MSRVMMHTAAVDPGTSRGCWDTPRFNIRLGIHVFDKNLTERVALVAMSIFSLGPPCVLKYSLCMICGYSRS